MGIFDSRAGVHAAGALATFNCAWRLLGFMAAAALASIACGRAAGTKGMQGTAGTDVTPDKC